MNLCYLVTVTFIGFCGESHGRSKTAAGPTSRRASFVPLTQSTHFSQHSPFVHAAPFDHTFSLLPSFPFRYFPSRRWPIPSPLAIRRNAATRSRHHPLHPPHPPLPPTSIPSYPLLSPVPSSSWSRAHNRPTYIPSSNIHPYPPSASCIYIILRRHYPCSECPIRSDPVWR